MRRRTEVILVFLVLIVFPLTFIWFAISHGIRINIAIFNENIVVGDNDYNGVSNRGKLPNHRMVLSYSLFGNGTRFNSGNGEQYKDCVRIIAGQVKRSKLYSDWTIRVYHDHGAAYRQIVLENKDLNIDFIDVHSMHSFMPNLPHILGKFWRNIPLIDHNVDVTCFRDLDSDLTEREEHAVKEWLRGSYAIHTMRDHPEHLIGMLAGMWCFRNELYRPLGEKIFMELYEKAASYKLRTDQPLLNEVVWDKYGKNSVQHDAYRCKHFPGSIPFPVKRQDVRSFVGCPGHGCFTGSTVISCPSYCRPKNHQDWKFC